MPPKAAKLLARLQQSKTGWKRNDLERLYKGFGFIIEGGGKHDKVYHPDFPLPMTSLPRHNVVHPYLVTQAIKLIEELQRLQEEQAEEETDE